MTDLTKPTKRIVRGCRVPHGCKDSIVVTLYPGGLIGLRELGRRREVQLDAGSLYMRTLLQEARAKRRKGKHV